MLNKQGRLHAFCIGIHLICTQLYGLHMHVGTKKVKLLFRPFFVTQPENANSTSSRKLKKPHGRVHLSETKHQTPLPNQSSNKCKTRRKSKLHPPKPSQPNIKPLCPRVSCNCSITAAADQYQLISL